MSANSKIVLVLVSFVVVVGIFFGIIIAVGGNKSKNKDKNDITTTTVETAMENKSEKSSERPKITFNSGVTTTQNTTESSFEGNNTTFTIPSQKQEELSEIGSEVSNAIGKINFRNVKASTTKNNSVGTTANRIRTSIATTNSTTRTTTRATTNATTRATTRATSQTNQRTTEATTAPSFLTESIVKPVVNSNRYTVQCVVDDGETSFKMKIVKCGSKSGYDLIYDDITIRVLLMDGDTYVMIPAYKIYYIDYYGDFNLDFTEFFYPYDNEFITSYKNGSTMTETYYSEYVNCTMDYSFKNNSFTRLVITENYYDVPVTLNISSFSMGADDKYFSLAGYTQSFEEFF